MYECDPSFVDTLKMVNSLLVIYKSAEESLQTWEQRSKLIDEISRQFLRAATFYKFRGVNSFGDER